MIHEGDAVVFVSTGASQGERRRARTLAANSLVVTLDTEMIRRIAAHIPNPNRNAIRFHDCRITPKGAD